MFGKFVYGQYSLSVAFWKFSVLGLVASSFVTRLLMIFLKQSVGYETRFLRIVWNNISLLSMNPATFTWLCFYIAAFLGTLTYCIVCIIGMWNTYKEYEKSKVLAFICMMIVWALVYFAMKYSIY